METKELTTHQRGIILRGISGGAASVSYTHLTLPTIA